MGIRSLLGFGTSSTTPTPANAHSSPDTQRPYVTADPLRATDVFVAPHNPPKSIAQQRLDALATIGGEQGRNKEFFPFSRRLADLSYTSSSPHGFPASLRDFANNGLAIDSSAKDMGEKATQLMEEVARFPLLPQAERDAIQSNYPKHVITEATERAVLSSNCPPVLEGLLHQHPLADRIRAGIHELGQENPSIKPGQVDNMLTAYQGVLERLTSPELTDPNLLKTPNADFTPAIESAKKLAGEWGAELAKHLPK